MAGVQDGPVVEVIRHIGEVGATLIVLTLFLAVFKAVDIAVGGQV